VSASRIESRLNRVAFVGIGVSLAIGGVVALFQRGFYSSFYAQFIDFGPHHEYVGILLITVGAAFAWVGVRRRHETNR
jgi:hypothetical protein